MRANEVGMLGYRVLESGDDHALRLAAALARGAAVDLKQRGSAAALLDDRLARRRCGQITVGSLLVAVELERREVGELPALVLSDRHRERAERPLSALTK